jgi:ABC-type dipeptide/oligopeptide/nickel transport system permease component
MGTAISRRGGCAAPRLWAGPVALVQYVKWLNLMVQRRVRHILRVQPAGDRGDRRPLWLTMLLSFAAIIVTWVLALPIGIYSAVRQYSIGDYVFTFIGFIGLAVPKLPAGADRDVFRPAVVQPEPRRDCSPPTTSWRPGHGAKLVDLLKHLPVPMLILALPGIAQLVRIMRANLLDELRRPYVVTARARGLAERRVILKYPVRAALNPFASTIGYLLPYHGVRQHHHLGGAQPADRRAAAAAFADLAGHAAGLDDHPAAGRADGDRHAAVGPAADVDRSAHPAGQLR